MNQQSTGKSMQTTQRNSQTQDELKFLQSANFVHQSAKKNQEEEKFCVDDANIGDQQSVVGEFDLQSALSDEEEEEASHESHLSQVSNWTKGKSRQRLRTPNSLKHNNQISKAVAERKIKMRTSPGQKQRKILKERNPKWSTKQVMRVVSQIWSKLSKQDKLNYKALSDHDRQRFDLERKKHKQMVKKSGKPKISETEDLSNKVNLYSVIDEFGCQCDVSSCEFKI